MTSVTLLSALEWPRGWCRFRSIRSTLRILQETRDPRFKPCRGGVFERNLVIYDARVETFVNVGQNTAPKTFRFRRNAWVPMGADRLPQLPAPEVGRVWKVDPKLAAAGTAKMRVTASEPRLAGIGADAYRPRAATSAPQSAPSRQRGRRLPWRRPAGTMLRWPARPDSVPAGGCAHRAVLRAGGGPQRGAR